MVRLQWILVKNSVQDIIYESDNYYLVSMNTFTSVTAPSICKLVRSLPLQDDEIFRLEEFIDISDLALKPT